jgi:hypothetical protein
MSAVELVVQKVKKLSAREARELLDWLRAREARAASARQPSRIAGRKNRTHRSMQRLKAWQDSIRFSTDWQPPRMPDDVVRRALL